MKKFLFLILFLALVAAAGAWWWVGRAGGPTLILNSPGQVVGRTITLDVAAETPPGELTGLEAVIEQEGRTYPLVSLADTAGAALQQETPGRLRVTRELGRQDLPDLKSGEARVRVTAQRTTLFGLRTLTSSLEQAVQVRLEPPRVAVLSLHHFVNHGGAEMVVYRATPDDVTSGVQVGERFYPGYPASGAGLADPGLRVAFFALLYDQDLNAPIDVVATDIAGNRARTPLAARVFPKPFRRSRIDVPDAFLARVVPAILDNTPDFARQVADPGDLVPAFLQINGALRQKNAEQIAAFAGESAPEILWRGAFRQLSNSKVESAFADHRTYFHDGTEIDRQVHLGYDLAVTAQIPILAANRGRVLHAGWLGIYGNTVILDHGMGVQSLYAHLSSIGVQPGDEVARDQELGRSGMTGLAGGDHLHFSMLVGGQFVSATEWWDAHWIEDRVLRKIREAGGTPPQ